MKDQKPITIAELYPDFTEAQLEQAEEHLRQYVAVLLRISKRLKSEGLSFEVSVDCRIDDSGKQR